MSDQVTVGIGTTFNPAGTEAAKAGFRGVGAEATKGEKQILQYAQAQAQLQRALGQPAAAATTLSQALNQVNQTSAQAVRASTQLTAANNAVAKSAQGAGSSMAVLPRTLDGLSGSAQAAASQLLTISAAMAAIKGGAELAQAGAQAARTRAAFEGLAESAHTTGDAIMTALRSASGGEISDLNLQLAANRANLLGVADSAQEFSGLMEIARDRAQKMGMTTTQAFNDLVTGLGRASPMILDNLGITVNAGQANEQYAASVGKTVAQLSEQEKKQALINAVLQQGQASIAASGGATSDAASSFEQLSASTENLKNAIGELLATGTPVVGWLAGLAQEAADAIPHLTNMSEQLQGAAAKALEGSSGFEDYAARVQMINDATPAIVGDTEQLSQAQYTLAQSLIASGASAGEALAKVQGLADTQTMLSSASEMLQYSAEGSRAAFDALQPSMLAVAAQSDYNKQAVENLTTAFLAGGMTVPQLQIALDNLSASHDRMTVAAQNAAAMESYRAGEQMRGTMTAEAEAAAQDQATAATLEKSAADQTAAVQAQALKIKTDAMAAAARIAAQALAAGGAAGAAAAGRLASSSKGVDQLTAAYYRLIQAQAAAGAATIRSGPQAAPGAASGAKVKSGAEWEAEKKGIAAEKAVVAAQKKMGRGGGGGGGRAAGGGGGGGGGARESAAEQTGTKLADIERQTGQKLADIDASTQDKLLAIDQKAAEARAQAARKLAADIATSSADMVAAQEADDLDLVGATEENAGKLAAREQAEAQARIRNSAAVAEAQRTAAEGNAQLAQDVLDIRQAAIAKQQALDQKYAERQQELAGNPEALAELQQQYNEATAAAAEAENVRVQLAQQAAQQRASAVDAEKQQVLAAAEEQKAGVLSKAAEAAAGIKNASAGATAAVVQGYKDQAAAAEQAAAAARSVAAAMKDIPAPASVPSGGGGGSGESAAAGGGTFMTHGPTTLTVGDNPGGMEMVSVVPVGGRGTTRVGGGMARMAGGGTLAAAGGGQATIGGATINVGDVTATFNSVDEIITVFERLFRTRKTDPGVLKKYIGILDIIVGALDAITGVRRAVAEGGATTPIDMGVANRLATEAKAVYNLISAYAGGSFQANPDTVKRLASSMQAAVDVLKSVTELRTAVAAMEGGALDLNLVQKLMAEAQAAVAIVRGSLVKMTEETAKGLSQYADAVGQAVDILSGIADLRDSLTDVTPPLTIELLSLLSLEAMVAYQELSKTIVPTTEETVGELERYHTAVSAALDMLSAVVDLRSSLAEPKPPITIRDIQELSAGAVEVLHGVQSTLVPVTQETADALTLYADAVGKAADAISAVAGLRSDLAEPQPPIDGAAIAQLAAESQFVLLTIQRVLIPVSQETADGLQHYSDAVGSSVDAVSALAGLRADVSDLAAPIDLQAVQALANEAQEVAVIVQRTLVPTSQETADGFQRYSDSVGSSADAISTIAGLRGDLAALAAPLDLAIVRQLASEAQQVQQFVIGTLIPTSQETADGLGRYGDSVDAAAGIVSALAGLRSDMTDLHNPIDPAAVQRLAREARLVEQTIAGTLVPVSQDEADGIGRYADAVGSAASVAKDALSLTSTMFTDYTSPSDAQLDMIAADAKRVAIRMLEAASTYSADGLEAGKAYAEGVGATFGAFKDGLLFFDALKSGDFELDPRKLAQFEAATQSTLATAARLGAKAATIPSGNLASLQATTAALSAQAEALIKLSAVPFDNLMQISGGLANTAPMLAGGGGGGGGQTINVYIQNPPANMDVYAVTQQAIRGIQQGITSRR